MADINIGLLYSIEKRNTKTKFDWPKLFNRHSHDEEEKHTIQAWAIRERVQDNGT